MLGTSRQPGHICWASCQASFWGHTLWCNGLVWSCKQAGDLRLSKQEKRFTLLLLDQFLEREQWSRAVIPGERDGPVGSLPNGLRAPQEPPMQGSWESPSSCTEPLATASPTLHSQMESWWFYCPQGTQTPWHKPCVVSMAVLGAWLELILECFPA